MRQAIVQRTRTAARTALSCALLAVCATPASARPLDDVLESKVLKVVVYEDNAPFSWSGDGAAKGIDVDLGKAVIFEVGPVTLMITELRGVAGNVPGVYEALGIDPAAYKMAVLKTASNFQFFASITSEVIRVDTRGPGQSDVFSLPWKRIPRPIYPLEPIDDWRQHSSQPGQIERA